MRESYIVTRRYCFEFTIAEMVAINRNDFEVDGGTLCEKLNKLPEVGTIEYDGMFGPHVWVDIDDEDDTPEIRTKVVAIMDEHVKLCMELTE